MAALTFSWPYWTLMVVAASAFTFADQQITRHTGMNVTLKFPVSNGTTSLWLKRAGSDKYISYCQDRRPTRPEDQEESFKGRVEGTDCDKINGPVTITLSNLTSSDNGTYEFQSVDSDGRRFNETIFLNVTDPGPSGGDTEDGGKEDGGKEDGGRKEEARFSSGYIGLMSLGISAVSFFILASAHICCSCHGGWREGGVMREYVEDAMV